MEPKRGNIILIPKGTPVTHERKSGGWAEPTLTRRGHVTVVDYTTGAGDEFVVGWQVNGRVRETGAANVELLDAGNHTLSVGRRRIMGGHPIRGMGNIYSTSGHCGCGDEYVKRPDARDVRQMHREHVVSVGERARAMA